jgi:TRAP-type uncharacterized transport system fused permease subunit
MFVLDASGANLLLTGSIHNLAQARWLDIAEVTVTAMVGIAALAAGLQGWLFRRTSALERWLLVVAGVLLVYPRPWADVVGLALAGTVVVLQKLVRMRAAPS